MRLLGGAGDRAGRRGVRLTNAGSRLLDDIIPVLQMAEAVLQRASAAGRVDVAFFTGSAPLTGCEVEELWRERVHVAMAVQHPLAGSNSLDWPQLRKERFIVSTLEPGPEVHDYIVRRIADYSTYPDVTYRRVNVKR